MKLRRECLHPDEQRAVSLRPSWYETSVAIIAATLIAGAGVGLGALLVYLGS